MNITATNLWSVYAYTYDLITPNFQSEIHSKAVSQMEGVLLDLGAATGKLIPHAKARAMEYHGVDTNQEMLALARNRHSGRLYRADIMCLPFKDSSFDSVAALNSLYAVADFHNGLAEATRVLKDGGVLTMLNPDKNCDIAYLANETDKEMKERIAEEPALAEVWDLHVRCNNFIIREGAGRGFRPHVFSMEETLQILERAGYEIISNEKAYHGQANYIVSRRNQ